MRGRLTGSVVRFGLVVLMIGGIIGLPPAGARAAAGKADWTVLLYYASDNNLEGQLMRDLNQVEAIGSTDQVNFIAFVDRSPGYWTGSGNWSDTRYFRLVKDNNLFNITSPALKELGNQDSGAPETLQNFLEWGMGQFPARHYMLVIADHGGAWQGAAEDDTSGEHIISPAGLQQAISGALKKRGVDKLDLITFDACLMAELEVWELLAPTAHYGVSSEEITYGFDGFEGVMQSLADQPTMTGKEIGQALVQGFGEVNSEQERGTRLTMSEVNLDSLPRLARDMDVLARLLLNDVTTAQTALAVAQGQAHSPSFADTDRDFFGMVDLRSFLLIVQKLSNSPQVNKAAAVAQRDLEQVVVEHYAGTDVPSVGGLSFFFPNRPRVLDIYTEGYKDVLPPMPGADTSPWIKFLYTFNTALPRVVEKPKISQLKLDQGSIAEGETAQLEATVGGIGMKEVDLVIGRVEGDAVIPIDSNRLVLNKLTVAPGLTVPAWDPKGDQMSATWDGAGWMLSNGERQVPAWLQASAPDSTLFGVPGFIRSVAASKDLEGEIQFSVDVQTGEATYLGAFARQESGLLGPYVFEPGDAFVVKRQVIHITDGSVEEQKGGTLIVGQSPPQLISVPVPSGIYQFGIRAVNLADKGTLRMAELTVDHPSQEADYKSRALSFATRYPSDWIVEESAGLVTFTPDELSAVKAEVSVIPLARLGASSSTPVDQLLEDILNQEDMLRTVAGDESVLQPTPGEVSDASLAGRDARLLDYTYELALRGEISGSMVAFVDDTTDQLYLSVVEAPTSSIDYEQAALDLVRDNLTLLPAIFVNRTYANQTMGFSLTYNDYWQVVERPANGDVFFRTTTLDGALRVQERPGKSQPNRRDNDALIRVFIDETLAREQDFQAGEPADVTISGLNGRQLEYSVQDSEGETISGTVTAVTTRDGRGFILNGELAATSAQLDILTRDLKAMHASFSIVDPEASPVPNPGEGWKIYESAELHFGVAYLQDLRIKENLEDPNFQVVSFYDGDVVSIDVANIPLSPETPPDANTADELVTAYVDKAVKSLTEAQLGTMSDTDLAGIPARGVSYGGFKKIRGQPRPVEMEGFVLVAPTPYGFAYLVNTILPTQMIGGLPVDANVVPHLMSTFTPLLQGLTPVSQVGAAGEKLNTYRNASLGLSISVPAAWRITEQNQKVTFTATDEVGRPIDSYSISLEDKGENDLMSPDDMDGELGKLLSDAEQAVQTIESTGEPADAGLGGLSGRSLRFVAITKGRDVVDTTLILVQDQASRTYLATVAVPVTMLDDQTDTITRVLDSVQFETQ